MPSTRHATSGLIPAHAGKTRPTRYSRTRRGAHPRSRGENGTRSDLAYVTEGSSPLTRGKLEETGADLAQTGLIPAHAGKTMTTFSIRRISSAHPRSRGENITARGGRARRWGSSPLTRGKRVRPRARQTLGRLIPAHAGKTRLSSSSSCHGRAHPRSRGENLIGYSVTQRHLGSSPLTRGKRRRDLDEAVPDGLIPAHAGKTPHPTERGALGWAHPRSRGENVPWWGSFQLVRGSSPLTRGKPRRRANSSPRPGLIPAHAGKTALTRNLFGQRPAHPRSRGENANGI